MNAHIRDSIIDTVSSLCPECGKPVSAEIIDRDGKVYQRSQCRSHDSTEALIFSDADLYRKLEEWNKLIFLNTPHTAAIQVGGCCEASTGSNNEPCLAVIDITNRCNFKCPVCIGVVG